MIIGVPSLAARDRDRPRFQTARFSEFWQSAIPANESKKQMPKLSARANKVFIGVQNLQHEPVTDLVFKPHVFLSFGKSTIPANECKKQLPKL